MTNNMNLTDMFWHQFLAYQRISHLVDKFKINEAQINKQLSLLMRFVNNYRFCKETEHCHQININRTAYKLVWNKEQRFQIVMHPCVHGVKAILEKNAQQRFMFYDFPHSLLKLDITDSKQIYDLPERLAILRAMAQFKIKNNVLNKGFFLHGAPGTGKTYCFIAFANRLAMKYPDLSIGFASASTIIQTIKTSFKQNAPKPVFDLRSLQKVDILFIDDFGSEPWTSWLRDDLYFSIFNYRYSHFKTTFINSNFSLEEIENTCSDTFGKNQKLNEVKSKRLFRRIKALTDSYQWTTILPTKKLA